MKLHSFNFLIILLASLLGFWSCRNGKDSSSDINNLVFEADSIIFDTVFTDVGSATEVFLVYNKGHENLLLDEVFLAGGENSKYRLNFDGVPGFSFKNIEILPGDSLFAFAEVFIDPNNISNPFVVKDSIIFRAGKNEKDIKLVSWGQNAYFHYKDTIKISQIWTDDRPHILYGEVRVAKGATLTIKECTQIYGHNLSRLNIGRRSSLKVEGTAECPVVFKGDRKEARYEDEPGQWIGIRFLAGAGNSSIKHTVIKNGFRGLEVDSMPSNRQANVVIENSTISSMNLVCLLGYTASIKAVNCQFINSCDYLMVAELGGVYDFRFCTFGNFQKNCVRTKPSVYLSNADYKNEDGEIFENPLVFNFLNCIIYGGQSEEMGFNQTGKGGIEASIAHCLVRTNLPGFNINNNIINQDPKFVKPTQLNYKLDTLSPAIAKGLPIIGVSTDYFGNIRDPNNPDLGAFERQE